MKSRVFWTAFTTHISKVVLIQAIYIRYSISAKNSSTSFSIFVPDVSIVLQYVFPVFNIYHVIHIFT